MDGNQQSTTRNQSFVVNSPQSIFRSSSNKSQISNHILHQHLYILHGYFTKLNLELILNIVRKK